MVRQAVVLFELSVCSPLKAHVDTEARLAVPTCGISGLNQKRIHGWQVLLPLFLIDQIDNLFPEFRTGSKNLARGLRNQATKPRDQSQASNADLGDCGPWLSKAFIQIVQKQSLAVTVRGCRKVLHASIPLAGQPRWRGNLHPSASSFASLPPSVNIRCRTRQFEHCSSARPVLETPTVSRQCSGRNVHRDTQSAMILRRREGLGNPALESLSAGNPEVGAWRTISAAASAASGKGLLGAWITLVRAFGRCPSCLLTRCGGPGLIPPAGAQQRLSAEPDLTSSASFV